MLFIAAPECGADIRCKRQLVLQTIRQIPIRREVPAERDQVCIAGCHDRFGTVAVETVAGNPKWVCYAPVSQDRCKGFMRWRSAGQRPRRTIDETRCVLLESASSTRWLRSRP